MRHGETYQNAKQDVSNEQLFQLTPNGIEQAKQVGYLLKTFSIDHCYTSTLQRTQDTLEYALGKDITYESLDDLNELELRTGESRSDVCLRMKRICTELMEKENHQTVLAVSHAGASYCFLRNWLPKEEFKKHRKDGIPNTTIFKYEYENQVFKLIEIIRPTNEKRQN